jgi:hypothetical protein
LRQRLRGLRDGSVGRLTRHGRIIEARKRAAHFFDKATATLVADAIGVALTVAQARALGLRDTTTKAQSQKKGRPQRSSQPDVHVARV